MTLDFRKSFPGRFTVEAKLTMALGQSTALILFGPSGSGKTTILRSLAGLEWPEQGSIRFISRTWLDTNQGIRVAPQDREIGYMAQDYALFPTYSVAGNIGYGLGHLTSGARHRRIAEVVDLLQLRGMERIRPRELSGGQQQRVALARAIARRPQLLLLDEPLSALDAPTRALLRGELRAVLKKLALPSIIVTHDWAEVLALGDVVSVVADGKILQTGEPQDVFSRPYNADIATIVGVETVVAGRVSALVQGLATVDVEGVMLTAVAADDRQKEVFVCIRGEDVTLERSGAGGTSARNHLPGTVAAIVSLGAMARVTLDCGFPLVATVTRSTIEEFKLAVGEQTFAAVKAGSVHLVPRHDH